MDALFQKTAFKQLLILRNSIELIVKAAGGDESSYPLQLGLAEKKSEYGYKQVQIRYP